MIIRAQNSQEAVQPQGASAVTPDIAEDPRQERRDEGTVRVSSRAGGRGVVFAPDDSLARPFRLVRYFSIASAIAIGAVTILAAVLYRQAATNDLVEVVEIENMNLARSFSNSIWPRYSGYVRSVSGLDGDQMRARPETAQILEDL